MGIFSRSKPQPKSDEAQRSAPPVRYVWTQNMQLHVAAPTAAGWELMEVGGGQGGLLAAFRCIHGTPPQALALNAYAYRVPPDRQQTVAQLCEQDWRARWERSTFSSVESVTTRVAERPGADAACEVQVDGQGGEPAGPLRVVEQHVPAGSRLLVVSVAGPPDLHRSLASVVGPWLTHATLGA